MMYNPPDSDDYEFIELKNIGDTELDLSNATFTGIRYAFPPGAILQPGQIIVLVRDAPSFTERYPDVLYFDAS